MKAIIQNQYGDEKTLESVEVSAPTISKPNQFIVKVAYANISSGDKNINTLDQPFMIRLILKLLFGWKGLAKELKLALPDAPWHSHRDRFAEVAAALGLLTGTLGKIARDISLLSQTEVGEAFEPSAPGREIGRAHV